MLTSHFMRAKKTRRKSARKNGFGVVSNIVGWRLTRWITCGWSVYGRPWRGWSRTTIMKYEN